MLTPYLVLGLPTDADDETIRQRYLTLVKRHTPESDPIQFRRISESYEAIRDERRRIEMALFGGMDNPDYENELFRLAKAVAPKRRRVGLKEMIAAGEKHQ